MIDVVQNVEGLVAPEERIGICEHCYIMHKHDSAHAHPRKMEINSCRSERPLLYFRLRATLLDPDSSVGAKEMSTSSTKFVTPSPPLSLLRSPTSRPHEAAAGPGRTSAQPPSSSTNHLGGDGDLDLDAGLDVDDDLLDDLGGGG